MKRKETPENGGRNQNEEEGGAEEERKSKKRGRRSRKKLNQKFWSEVQLGNLREVQNLLQLKPDVNWANPNSQWKNPLQLASEAGLFFVDVCQASRNQKNTSTHRNCLLFSQQSKTGNAEMVKLLLSSGASVPVTPIIGLDTQPLLLAAERGHLAVAKILVESGAPVSPSQSRHQPSTLVLLAAQKGEMELAKFLIKSGSKFSFSDQWGSTALHYACKFADLELVKMLIYLGMDLTHRDQDQRIPFHYACLSGDVAVVEFLIKCQNSSPFKKEWLSVYDQGGHTGLRLAAGGGHLEVVKLLTSLGARMSRTHYGTEIHEAAENGHLGVMKFLASIHGEESLNQQANCGETPLHFAAQRGDVDVVKFLTSCPLVDVNKKNSAGRTPIGLAVRGRHSEIVKILADAGADLTRGPKGQKPLHDAVWRGNLKIVKILTRGLATSKLSTRNYLQFTPLHCGAFLGHLKIVQHLLSLGAELDRRTVHSPARALSSGVSPLEMALTKDNLDVAEYLIAHGADVKPFESLSRRALCWVTEFKSSVQKSILSSTQK